ncbi:MAG TPA: hypothetical protein VGG10_17330 [Rhizomicrobium sp.]
MRARRGIGAIGRRFENQPCAKRRKHRLCLETEEIERESAFLPIERPERSMPFRSARDLVAKFEEFGHTLGRVTLAACKPARIELPGQYRGERRQQVQAALVGMGGEKIRELHEMTVRIVDQLIAGVGHFAPPALSSSDGSRAIGSSDLGFRVDASIMPNEAAIRCTL